MIKLDDSLINSTAKDYFLYIIQFIEEAYKKNKINFPNQVNVTHKSFIDLFETNNKLNIQLIKSILIDPFELTSSQYPELKNYMLTSKLVFYSTSISEKLPKASSLKERKKIRKDFVSKYSNDWIDPIIQNSNYYESDKKFHNFIKDIVNELQDLDKWIRLFIQYDFLESKKRHELLVKLNNSVCPYCNRQYTTNYDEGGTKKSTADLDHFFPKSYFPLFSLSLYNFIPSCQICNSRFKLAKGKNILYPYDYGFEKDAKFVVKLKSNSDINSLIGNNSNFELGITADKSSESIEEIESSIELFRLNQLYQHHKEYVRELLYKKYAYSSTYKEQLEELFSEMKLDRFEINLFLYGNNLKIDELGRRPLSKLAFDILT
ncbi:hypothetical protein [Paenibacillus macquariensis]|uniref:HNH nuclease domain-containing protein n=1 Tax=Paenibacillus macquariensis TaxID=948756 RepID=A0ABY1KD02_9BACL|nr:hypothetical protein [Paenibacillus macquariensis]MEC0093211.1 hypothetical protein [Paenibacillus macquariensis]OAB35046.1 hypothetical protein PMSM_10690 [Paenibacillus macquariensis subsp. macquariensis]SIR62834.1 hypothetical protein SAMN05421578_12440 [Paenibacillus macquariensis]